ncbi:MAG: ABC transporter permease [Aestuariivirga sp.]
MNNWAPFEWTAAIRFLKEGRTQTMFIIIGIAIGVAVIVFMSALLTALQTSFISRVLTSQPHIQIMPQDEAARALRPFEAGVEALGVVQRPAQRLRSIDQWQSIARELKARADVAEVSATISASALALRGDTTQSIALTGIDADSYFRIVKIPDYITLGVPTLGSENIIIGSELAKNLGVTVGDKFNVTGANNAARSLTVSAIFDLGNRGANERTAFVALRTAQTLASLAGGVTAINVNVRDAYAAQTIAASVEAATGERADSWIKTNADFFVAVSSQEISFGIIEGFVALSVAFGIASVMVVSVIQRSKEIGILRAMGTSQRQILAVFLVQGAVLGFFGSLAGSVLGGAAFVVFHSLVRQSDGREIFPFLLQPALFGIAILLAITTGVAAAAMPAVRAARLDPVVAMRG